MSQQTYQVKIGPSFFEGAFKDYSNWEWAWVREILQNCQDAPNSTGISIDISELEDSLVKVVVTNNGLPMTKEVLIDKFFALGESGKRFQNGSVGGFGKAKELIAFCHVNWQIETGNLLAKGIGGEYTLEEVPYMYGTRTTVTMSRTSKFTLEHHIKRYARYANWHGTLILNGETLTTNLIKGEHLRDFDWGSLYVNKEFPANQIICRMNGIPMFYEWADYSEGCLILELSSSEVMTANRDSLRYDPWKEYIKFLKDLSTNKKAALQDPNKVRKVRFPGYKLTGKGERVKEIEINQTVKLELSEESNPLTNIVNDPEFRFRPDFYLKSDLDIEIPAKYFPDTLSKNSKQLLEVWAKLLVELATLTNSYRCFSIGFVFSETSIAEYECFEGNHIIYINPAKLEDGNLLNRWTAKNHWDLVSSAIHEFVHLEGYHSHNEEYAGRLTNLMSLVMENLTKFRR